MNITYSAHILANYISSLDDFNIPHNHVYRYNHMGAVLTDTVLQAGLNYRTVVEPRVICVIKNYPEANITSSFLSSLYRDGANKILNWHHPEKPRRLLELTEFFCETSNETEDDLQKWLIEPINCDLLLRIRGIGPKTVDYLKNLVSLSSVAVDRHIRKFVKNAGVSSTSYEEIRFTVVQAANVLNLSPSILDHAIWIYMSKQKL